MKYYRMSWDEIMWQRSFSNLQMLMATIPRYDPDEETDEEGKPKDEKVEWIEGKDLKDLIF